MGTVRPALAVVNPDPFPAGQPQPDPCYPGPGPDRVIVPGALFHTVQYPVKSGTGNAQQIAGAQPSARARVIVNFGDGLGVVGTTVYVGPVDQKGNLLTGGARILVGASRTINTNQEIWCVSDAGEPAGGNIVDVTTEYDG